MTEEQPNFEVYTPRSENSLRQRKPHVRVETAKNQRTRFMMFAAVRDWLQLTQEREADEPHIEILLDQKQHKIIIRKLRDDQASKQSAVPVRGLRSSNASGYFTLPAFTRDFSIPNGKYEAQLTKYQDSKAVLIDVKKGPTK